MVKIITSKSLRENVFQVTCKPVTILNSKTCSVSLGISVISHGTHIYTLARSFLNKELRLREASGMHRESSDEYCSITKRKSA